MDEFLKTLGSLYWWLSVVLVGFMLNLLAAYAKDPTDRLASALSRSWRQRSERSQRERNALIGILRQDPTKREEVFQDEIRCGLRLTGFGMLAIFFLLYHVLIRLRVTSDQLGDTTNAIYWVAKLTFWFSLFLIFLALANHMRSISYRQLLVASRNDPTGGH